MDDDPTGDTLDDETRAAVGKLIAEIRKRANLSQPQLAMRAGLSQATLSKAERGLHVSDDSLVDIALALAPHSERILNMAGLPTPDVEPWDSPGDDFYPVTGRGLGATQEDLRAAVDALIAQQYKVEELRRRVERLERERDSRP